MKTTLLLVCVYVSQNFENNWLDFYRTEEHILISKHQNHNQQRVINKIGFLLEKFQIVAKELTKSFIRLAQIKTAENASDVYTSTIFENLALFFLDSVHRLIQFMTNLS